MRSDAAPALDVTIAPTWSGIHTWTLTNTATSAGNVNTLLATNTANPASSSAATYNLFRGSLAVQGGNTQNFTTSFQSMYFSIDHGGSGNINVGINFYSRPALTSTGGFTNLYGFRSDYAATAASTTGTFYPFHCSNPSLSGGAAITTMAAFHAGALTAAGTNYLLKGDGAGLVSIGDTTDASSLTVASTVLAGGLAVAKSLFLGSSNNLITANGAKWIFGSNSELLTLSTSGTTTDTAGLLLPANAIIESVDARVTTTITTATNWELGDATTAGRFSAPSSSLTAGSTVIGLVHIDQTGAAGPRQTAAAKVRVTTTGTPGAGVIRITVWYRQLVAPTS